MKTHWSHIDLRIPVVVASVLFLAAVILYRTYLSP
jgi:hypothetical protein